MDRDGEHVGCRPLRVGAGRILETLIGGLLVHRDRVVDTRADSGTFELLSDRVARVVAPRWHPQGVLVINVPSRRVAVGAREPFGRDALVIILGVRAPPRSQSGKLPQLSQADRGLDFGHAEVVGNSLMQVRPNAVGLVAQTGTLLGNQRIVRDHHAAFARGEILRGIERIDSRAKGAEGATTYRRSNRLAGVLDQDKPVVAREPNESVEVAGVAMEVYRHDRPGPGPNHSYGGIRIEIERVVYIGENRTSAGMDNRVCRGNERQWARDDLVVWTDAMGKKRQVKCGTTVGRGDGEPGSHRHGKGIFKSLHAYALGEHAGPHHAQDGGLLF